jgi:hypothetical protein
MSDEPADLKNQAREAIYKAIIAQAENLADYGDSRPAAEGLNNLAEALAWLNNSSQPHG